MALQPSREQRILEQTPTKIRELCIIAMPTHASSSPPSFASTSSTEPENFKELRLRKRSRKHPRKQHQQQQVAKPKVKTTSPWTPSVTPPKQQTAHNIIEKRYRNNLNNKINVLRDSVPNLCSEGDSAESCEPKKLNKVRDVPGPLLFFRGGD
jgi:hypothetical protein